MTKERAHPHVLAGMKVGATLGILAFLILGLAPSVEFGRHAGHLLASGISHTRELPALIWFGTALGVIAIGSLFTVSGAVLGTGVGRAVVAATGAKNPNHS